MIGHLRGVILEKQPPEVLIEVGGVGYEVAMPMTSFYELPDEGQEVAIYTHFVVREDAQLLYGFSRKEERTLFRELIKVSGFGPKLALAILSGLSGQQLIFAIENSDINTLVKLPGVGKKTAERLVIEMKDRIKRLDKTVLVSFDRDALPLAPVAPSDQAESEAVSALVALGYKPQEASRMVSKVATPEADSETLIRDALRSAL